VNIYVRLKNHKAASESLLTLTPLLKLDEEKQQYNDMLLMQLIALSPRELSKYQTTNLTLSSEVKTESLGADTNTLAQRLTEIQSEIDANKTTKQLSDKDIYVQGWYALANLYQRYQLRTNQLLRSLTIWKQAYPTHPVLSNMPTPLRNISETSPYHPSKIAVLLPLSGRFQQEAQAIQYGISNAYFNQITLREKLKIEEEILRNNMARLSANNYPNQINLDASTESEFDLPPPSLLFFDTNAMSIEEIAKQLHADDIDFVIGPLLKPNLESFLPLVENIPVLMLNALPYDKTTDDAGNPKLQGSSLHYAFALSPEGEAEQAAELIFQNKHRKPLILAPKSNYGQRVATAFETRWEKLNTAQQDKTESMLESYPAETHYFSSKPELAKFIDSTMQTNKSKQRINQIKGIINKPLQTEVRSRRDVDAIYLVSDRSELILLKPFIAVSISPFAKNIPIYASSRSHDLDLTGQQNKELSNLIFSDIAFLMDNKSEINQQVQAIWPTQGFSTLRLFALGYDSYNLIEQLKQLQVIEGHYFLGLTGELTLDKSNTINTKLQWAKYQKGNLVEVTAPSSNR
jgi:outer membrane PBP1 activator LpoA protein